MKVLPFSFRPAFEGDLKLSDLPEDWSERLQRRVADGFLVRGRRARANYRVVLASRDQLVLEAVDFATAYAIGLNDVELRRSGPDSLAYRVSFARWNRYAVAHGVLLGVVLAMASLHPSLQAQIESQPFGSWIFWSMAAFWSLLWPWILTGIHRGFARRTLEAILLEELTDSEPSRFPVAS